MKKLDEEYKKACAEETPDLWNRIEAGLPQKTEQTAKEKDRAAASPQTQSSASKAGTGTQTQAAIRKVWMRYGAFVAAAVMVLVTVPGLLHMTQARNTAENAAPMSVQDMTAAKENTTGMTDTEGIAADSADTAFAEAFPGECDDANGAAVENSSATEMLSGVSSMELKVTAVEEYDGYELVSAVSGDGMFETKAVFPEEVKKKLDFTLTEGEYYTFTLRQDTDKDFPYCHIIAVEQEGE